MPSRPSPFDRYKIQVDEALGVGMLPRAIVKKIGGRWAKDKQERFHIHVKHRKAAMKPARHDDDDEAKKHASQSLRSQRPPTPPTSENLGNLAELTITNEVEPPQYDHEPGAHPRTPAAALGARQHNVPTIARKNMSARRGARTAEQADGGEEPKKPVVLTGKAGTLKRKRQLQELMKQYNEGHEDEAFEDGITPFKKQGKISKGLISMDYNADEDDDVHTDVATRQDVPETPMSRLFGHSSSAAEPTPKGLSLRTPGAIGEEVHKSNVDKYVFKQQKAKKGKAIDSGPIKTLGESRKAGKKDKVSNIDFSKLLTAQMQMEEDDSDEEDDYFSGNGD